VNRWTSAEIVQSFSLGEATDQEVKRCPNDHREDSRRRGEMVAPPWRILVGIRRCLHSRSVSAGRGYRASSPQRRAHDSADGVWAPALRQKQESAPAFATTGPALRPQCKPQAVFEDGKGVGHALLVWVGDGGSHDPRIADARVREQFGDAEADRLLPRVRRLVTEFYGSDASQFSRDPEEMGAAAAASFSERHPDIPEEAIEALARLYGEDFG
jgi:hypothetical protein